MGVLGYLCMCILIVSWAPSLCVCVLVGNWACCREDPVSTTDAPMLLQSQFSCGSVHELSLIETTMPMI